MSKSVVLEVKEIILHRKYVVLSDTVYANLMADDPCDVDEAIGEIYMNQSTKQFGSWKDSKITLDVND